MKHEIDEATRAIVRGIITTIRTRHNCTREEAESYFRRNVGTSEVVEVLMELIDDDIQEQKEQERDMKDITPQ